MKRRFHIKALDTSIIQALASHLAYRSCWFEFEPLPDSEYYVTVKADVAWLVTHILEKDQILEIKNMEV